MEKHLIRLNNIKDNPKAYRKRKILGRGLGSGLGKTSGRGGKGQTARSGSSLNGFEGGQNPIYRRLPKRGFNNFNKLNLYELTFKKLETLIENKRIDLNKEINREELIKSGIMKKKCDGISFIATGTPESSYYSGIKVRVRKASLKVIEYIRKNNGQIIIEK